MLPNVQACILNVWTGDSAGVFFEQKYASTTLVGNDLGEHV